MARGTIDSGILDDLADAIRGRTGGSSPITPVNMPSAVTNLPNAYVAGDEGKVVSNGALVTQTARSSEITQNGTYDTTLNNQVTVSLSESPNIVNIVDDLEDGTFDSNGINAVSSYPIRIRTKSFFRVTPGETIKIYVSSNKAWIDPNMQSDPMKQLAMISTSFYSTNDYTVARSGYITWNPDGMDTLTIPSDIHYIRILLGVNRATIGSQSNSIYTSDINGLFIERVST